MALVKQLLFSILTVGYTQISKKRCGIKQSDGSVSCIIFVASSMGFLFPVLETLESPVTKSFGLYFSIQVLFGCLCFVSSVAWLYLLFRSRRQPELYLNRSISVIDPAANIMYVFLIFFTIGIILNQGLNVILDMTCYIRFVDYHYLCTSINRFLEVLFCIFQTLTLIFLTRSRFQNKLEVNYVLAVALITNGSLWMFTSVETGSSSSDNRNKTSEIILCYLESSIYKNILSPTWKIALQIRINYFLLCLGMAACTLPTGLSLPETNEALNSSTEMVTIERSGNEEQRTRLPDIVTTFVCLASFLPCTVVFVLKKWTCPPEVSSSEYLREWYLPTSTCPMIFLIIAVYRGLHRIKKYPRERNQCHQTSVKWIFKNDVIFIICLMGDVSRSTLTGIGELDQSFLFLTILLRLCYIFQIFLQTVFLLITERISLMSFIKLRQVALYLCVGNLVIWIYTEYLVKPTTTYTELPPEFEQIMFSLSSMNRFLSFIRSYRIYSLSKSS